MAVTPAKTIGTSLLAWQDIAAAAQVMSDVLDVSTAWAVACAIQLGRATGTAFTAGWPTIRLEASGQASGNDAWIALVTLQPLLGASIVNTTLNGAVSAGASTFVVASASNIAVGDLLFLGDASAANYELCRVKSVSGTTMTPEEALTNAHSAGALVTDQAEAYFPALDVSVYSRLRVVVDNLGSGQGIKVRVTANVFTAF